MLPPACANAAHVAFFLNTQAKIDAKIAEAQASLAAKEAAKKEEQTIKLGEVDRATALEAEKAQQKAEEVARKAQEFIDAEKAPDAFKPVQPRPTIASTACTSPGVSLCTRAAGKTDDGGSGASCGPGGDSTGGEVGTAQGRSS